MYLLDMEFKFKISFLLLLLTFTQLCSSQILRTRNWHFGYNTSLIFEKDTVLVDTSAIHSDESCTSISDEQGNLLLYSDGVTVWNKNHQVIGNGTGILGHQSSSRGSVLLPFENKDSVFYLFTTDYQGNSNGLRYSKIINLGNDSFHITSKNNLLNSSVAEPIGAINHQDNIRQWIMVRQFNGYNYYAFLLGKDGVVDCPVISKSTIYIGKSTNPVSAQNDCAFSPSGDKFSSTYVLNNGSDIFEFNNFNGTMSKNVYLSNIRFPTGTHFSYNNKFLYISEAQNSIIQIRVDTVEEFFISKNKYYINNSFNNKFDLQLTPEYHLLLIQQGSQFFGKIEFPNRSDSSCNYMIEGLPLGKAKWRYGLPNFNFSYFHRPSIDFSYDHNCRNNSYGFEATDTFQAREFIWRFNTSHKQFEKNGEKVQISLMDTGWWQVTLVGNGAYQSDSVTKNIYVYERIVEDFLGNDTSVCVGDSLTFELKTPKDMHCIHWMGQTGQDYENYHKESYKVDSNGTYTVKMTNKAFCTFYDTINVNLIPLPEKPVISYATGELAGTVKTAKYNWYLNDTFLLQTTERSILPLKNGYYRLQYINENGCEGPLSDSFWVGNVGMIPANPTDILIFPNPSNGEINIKVAESAKYDVDIFDIGGKLVFSESYDILDEKALRIDLLSGNYHLKVTYRNQYFLTKLVIQP